jgi:hypothetical protein
MTATGDFLEDPFGFAKVHALVPELSSEPTDRLKAKVVDAKLTMYQVKGESRVLFAKLEPHPTEINRYDFLFSSTQLTSDWFPVYWLPWEANQTYRITLKPSAKHPTLGLDGKTAEPSVFVTAALTGCLVQADGDPWHPTVYHSNAQTLPVPPPPSPKEAKAWTMMRKGVDMEERIAASTAHYPKAGRHYEPRSANAFQYTPFVAFDKDFEKAQEKAEKEVGADANSGTLMAMGSVFGIKDGGGPWSFYYQSLSKLFYSKDSVPFKQWIVNTCARFWPGSDIDKPIELQEL